MNQTAIKEKMITNLSFLHNASSGNKDFVKEMITIFLSQNPTALKEAKVALSEENWVLLKMAVHKIKPTLKMIGIKSLEKDIKILEEQIKQRENPETILPILNKMEETCLGAYEELNNELTKL